MHIGHGDLTLPVQERAPRSKSPRLAPAQICKNTFSFLFFPNPWIARNDLEIFLGLVFSRNQLGLHQIRCLQITFARLDGKYIIFIAQRKLTTSLFPCIHLHYCNKRLFSSTIVCNFFSPLLPLPGPTSAMRAWILRKRAQANTFWGGESTTEKFIQTWILKNQRNHLGCGNICHEN